MNATILLRHWLNSALFGQEAGKLDMLIRLACRLIPVYIIVTSQPFALTKM